MRKLALAVLTLALLCWQPSPAVTQLAAQGPTTQDRDDRQHDHDHDNDHHDADHHDRDRDDRGGYDNAYREHYRNQNYNGRFPRGSFARTCRDIRMDGNNLRASCQKNDSHWRDTTLKNGNSCQGQVINDNGRLRCM